MDNAMVWESLRYRLGSWEQDVRELGGDIAASHSHASVSYTDVNREVIAFLSEQMGAVACSELRRDQEGDVWAWDVVRFNKDHISFEFQSCRRRPMAAEKGLMLNRQSFRVQRNAQPEAA